MTFGKSRAKGEQGTQLALLERFSPQMLATARRYSADLDDAQDAYQRAAEILLTRGPERPTDDMCRWLRTTVKHEAIAIRRQRERTVPLGAPELVPEPSADRFDTHERVERFERLSVGAQALSRLKPQEVRCLLLRAEGYTYNEICKRTGYSYTKVDRSLKEGRRAFTSHLAGIEAGDECERLAPLLSALADGEADAGEVAQARSHLRTCLACRARLREYRAAPSRVAALVPPAALTAGGHGGGLRSLLESVAGAAQDRVAAMGDRVHQAAELAAGQKVAAVAASAAALAGGGAAGVDGLAERSEAARNPGLEAPAERPVEPPPPPVVAPTPAEPAPAAAAPAPPPTPPAPRPPAPSREFAPDAARTAPAPPGGEFAPDGGDGGGGGGEFGP